MSSNNSQPMITKNNLGPLVNIITWFLDATAVLFVVARLTTKVALNQRIRIDDGLLIISMLFSIAFAVTVSLGTQFGGLGQHQTSLLNSKLTTFQKTAYAGDLFYISSLTLSKLSLLILLQLITPITLHRRLISAIGATIALWGFSALLATSFQCRLPMAWAILSNQCFNKVAFWIYFGVLNIILEGILVALPVAIVWKVQMPFLRKSLIVWCFAVRVFLIAAVVCELVFRYSISEPDDYTFDSWPVAICTQFVQALSIMTACVPYLKPFFSSLESGMIRSDDSRRLDFRSTWGIGYSKTSGPKKNLSSTMLKSIGSKKIGSGIVLSVDRDITIDVGSREGNGQGFGVWDTGSQTSQARMIDPTAG